MTMQMVDDHVGHPPHRNNPSYPAVSTMAGFVFIKHDMQASNVCCVRRDDVEVFYL